MGSERLPLLQKHCEEHYGCGGGVTRTGSVWTAAAHIITGVIGSGVLSLSWSMAHLGWIAGPAAIFSFAATTLFTSFLLSSCRVATNSYSQAVRTNLGSTNALLCGLILNLVMCGYGIAYTVTTSISMRSIYESYCSHGQGRFGDWLYMLIFGLLQIFLSQIPNFHDIQWLSVVAAVMSLTYALVGFGLGLATLIANGYAKGSIAGVSSPDKVWSISQALGDVAFSYPFSIILFEIQDTLRSPPPQSETMKKASTISIVVTTFFYLFCGGFGYAAFGDQTPGNLMTAFGGNQLVDLANACIVLHLVGGYQIYSQPLFAAFEKWLAQKLPESEFVTKEYPLRLRPLGEFNVNPLRLCFRTAYVVSTTVIAIAFPYFNQILGVLGGLNFWPMTIYFPVEMYLRQNDIEPWATKWILLRIFSAVFLITTVFALVGSIQGIISEKLR